MRCFIILISYFAIVAPATVLAQQATGSLKVGVSATSIYGDTDTSFDPRAGLVGGAGVGYDFGNGLAVQAEVLYLTKGAYADINVGPDQDFVSLTLVRARFDLIYLDVPVMLTYRPSHWALQPKLFAGPMLSYNASAQVTLRAIGSDFSQTEPDDSVETFEYGVVVGVGLEKEIAGEQFGIEVRGFLGQSNIRKPDPTCETDPSCETAPPLHNRGLLFLLGFTF